MKKLENDMKNIDKGVHDFDWCFQLCDGIYKLKT